MTYYAPSSTARPRHVRQRSYSYPGPGLAHGGYEYRPSYPYQDSRAHMVYNPARRVSRSRHGSVAGYGAYGSQYGSTAGYGSQGYPTYGSQQAYQYYAAPAVPATGFAAGMPYQPAYTHHVPGQAPVTIAYATATPQQFASQHSAAYTSYAPYNNMGRPRGSRASSSSSSSSSGSGGGLWSKVKRTFGGGGSSSSSSESEEEEEEDRALRRARRRDRREAHKLRKLARKQEREREKEREKEEKELEREERRTRRSRSIHSPRYADGTMSTRRSQSVREPRAGRSSHYRGRSP